MRVSSRAEPDTPAWHSRWIVMLGASLDHAEQQVAVDALEQSMTPRPTVATKLQGAKISALDAGI